MKICILDNTSFKYNSKDKYSPILRGGETAVINLSQALRHLGHNITILSNCPNNELIDDISWININHLDSNNLNRVFDVAISNANNNLFDKITSKTKIVLSHSIQTVEKFIRKKQLFSYLKHKPKVVLLSEYHKKKMTKLSTLFGYIRLNYAVDEIFLKAELDNKIDENLSIFTSRADRNLDLLINIWNKYIFPKYNHGKLLITPPLSKIDLSNNIYLRKMNTQQNMLNDLKKSKIFLVPGHKAELFCLAAEEARELCVPIITLGIGCLTERVVHEKTGFIAKNDKEFSNYVIELYNNKILWNEMRNNLLKLRSSHKWEDVARTLLAKI